MLLRLRWSRLTPLDRVAILSVAGLSLVILLLVLSGSFCTSHRCLVSAAPRVREFSWRDRLVRADDVAFILKFSRPMDRESVEQNLAIAVPTKPDLDEPLPGKVSWAGRRLAYTLDFPAPYGNTYQLELAGAREQFARSQERGATVQPFQAEFRTPDRAFVYIGLDGDERGRLVLYNLTAQEKRVLTPPELIATEFKPYPDASQLLFSAVARAQAEEGILAQQLYRVATGIGADSPPDAPPELVLDNQDYQNLNFDLSPDGKTIVVQRINREDPSDFGLWTIAGDRPPVLLSDSAGGVFSIAPDNQTVATTKGEGIAVLPLDPEREPLDFLPDFGLILGFRRDGTAAVMVDFNRDDPEKLFTRSLYLVTNQGLQELLLDTTGSVLDCQFAPSGDQLYCLLTELLEGEEYAEQPYIAAIDTDAKQMIPLMTLPAYQDIHLSLAPDGLGLLFDQIETESDSSTETVLQTDSGAAIASGELWLLLTSAELPTADANLALEQLPFNGFQPQWLP
ncbi:MAG: Ig-like domain-containing protein [Spirulinaceae cyanobacterium SM2_1_0]|nr:Ig-like domain-containing protein [Spirulinaceae cyanobacterium SM2_1_0]